jgi:hemolysin III
MGKALSADADEAIFEKVKPRYRGVSHEIAFFVALASGAYLLAVARSGRALAGSLVYALSLAAMLGFSALYHRPMWGLKARKRLRRLDHAGIFLLIAGTYTPVCLLGLPPSLATPLLWIVWGGAALGVVHAVFFVHAFRSLNAVLYVVLGCVSLPVLPAFWTALGPVRACLVLGGGVIYIAGAVVYARRWPNPRPAVFGYHEVFHAMVIAAASVHFAAVLNLVSHAA